MVDQGSLASLHPRIRPFLQELQKEKFGICGGKMEVQDVKSGAPSSVPSSPSSTSTQQLTGDRFKLLVPVAGLKLTIMVAFDHLYPEDSPDFAFEDQDFSTFMAQADWDACPSLKEWDAGDPTSLCKAIREIMALYKSFQVTQFEDMGRLNLEYSLASGYPGIEERNLEVAKNHRGTSPINFLMRLPIDMDSLPPNHNYLSLFGYPNEDDNSDWAALLVSFHAPEGNRITPTLILSPALQSLLSTGARKGLTAPPFTVDGCLLDYIPSVMTLLEDRIKASEGSLRKRKALVDAMQNVLHGSVVEFDSELYSQASFLLEHRDFHFLFHIFLPRSFPFGTPDMVLQSIYSVVNGKPYSTVYDTYPYSPRWTHLEMARRMKAFLIDNVEAFQKESMHEN